MEIHPSAALTGAMRKEISLADLAIGIDLRFPEYEALFDRFPAQKPPEIEVSVSPQALAAAQKLYEPGSGAPYIEYMELCPKLSDAMLPFNRVFFHGTAFLWRGKAWIFAAVSGTGKTTQYLHWKALYGEEVQIINGDKPVLAFDDGNITVHPSPWNGKEGMGQDPPLPAAFNLRKEPLLISLLFFARCCRCRTEPLHAKSRASIIESE